MTDLVLLGMGGSSLAPEVMARALGGAGLPLTVVDSTHPQTVLDMGWLFPANTLFVVASKSGSTLETMSLFHHFWSRVRDVTDSPGEHFIAITDPGSSLAELARERGFLAVVESPPDVGGRFSALSPFGLVPAVLMDIGLEPLIASAVEAADACRAEPRDNPGLRLGAALAELARAGRDKVTFVTSNAYEAVPDWLEQLIAESTGKDGKGIIPIAHEPEFEPDDYGDDRLFVGVVAPAEAIEEAEQWGEPDDSLRRLDALEASGHPVVRVEVDAIEDLLSLFFVWEVAVAMAGAALGIHPFNQPDVQLAKALAQRAMSGDSTPPQGGGTGSDDAEGDAEGTDLDLAWDVAYYGHAGSGPGGVNVDELTREMSAFLEAIGPGDYVAIQAYLPGGDPEELEALGALRETITRTTGAATTLGYGPRFLHSTGQLHKGGPDSAVFLQLVDDAAAHVPVPGTDYTFHQLIRAQARGDLEAMEQRGRRGLRVRVGPAAEGIRRLIQLIER
jgi:transaldolase/glucose-6-phosphate isomerase